MTVASETVVQPQREASPTRDDKAAEAREKKRFHVNPWLDLALTTAFFSALIWTVYTLWHTHPFSLFVFLGGIPLVYLGIRFCKYAFQKFGRWLSDGPLRGAPFNRPLHNKVKMQKFRDQSYQFAIHVFSVISEIYILSDETWWDDTKTCWIPHPREQYVRPFVRYFYMIQLSIWAYMGIVHKFFEAKRSDYVTMYLHHITTLLLVSGSHAMGYDRIGILVMYVHDISDIPIDMLKMTNYLRLADRAGYFLTELSYASTIISWLYYRLFLFPYKVISSPAIESLSIVIPKDDPWYGNFWHALTHGVEQFPLWHMMSGLLSCLWCMHCVWFYLLARIGLKLMMGNGARNTSKDEYEGDSEDED